MKPRLQLETSDPLPPVEDTPFRMSPKTLFAIIAGSIGLTCTATFSWVSVKQDLSAAQIQLTGLTERADRMESKIDRIERSLRSDYLTPTKITGTP